MPKHTPTIKDIHAKAVEVYEMFLSQSPKAKANSLARFRRAIEVEKDAGIRKFLQSFMAICEEAAERPEVKDER